MTYDRAAQRELRRAVGMVFQDADSQVFSASVREDVSFGPMNLGLDIAEVRRRVDEALHDLGIAALADRPVHALSYGQKKRVSLAGVLAMRPEVLVLDEPFSGLDPLISADLLGILTKMNESGMTLLLATHDVDFAYEWADDVVVLDAGRVLAAGEACDVLGRPEIRESLGAVPFALDVARAAGLHDRGPLRSREALLGELASKRSV
jgi:cobalt/nickel transport system ATP-binding protein